MFTAPLISRPTRGRLRFLREQLFIVCNELLLESKIRPHEGSLFSEKLEGILEETKTWRGSNR
jgi:hypothetical protein